jgi:hypothetical protein
MTAPGEISYWLATIVAGLILVLAAANTLYTASISDPIVPIAALLLAGAIWVIGWFCRHVCAN